MRPDDLRAELNRQPFQPFRLHLSTGAFFDIGNPETAQVERSKLTIGMGIEGDKQRFVVIGLVHVVWLEMLLPTA